MKHLISAFLVILAGAVSAQDAAPRLAKIVEVKGEASDVTRRFFGHVAAKETVDLAFQVGGQIVELPIVEGETILKGALRFYGKRGGR